MRARWRPDSMVVGPTNIQHSFTIAANMDEWHTGVLILIIILFFAVLAVYVSLLYCHSKGLWLFSTTSSSSSYKNIYVKTSPPSSSTPVPVPRPGSVSPGGNVDADDTLVFYDLIRGCWRHMNVSSVQSAAHWRLLLASAPPFSTHLAAGSYPPQQPFPDGLTAEYITLSRCDESGEFVEVDLDEMLQQQELLNMAASSRNCLARGAEPLLYLTRRLPPTKPQNLGRLLTFHGFVFPTASLISKNEKVTMSASAVLFEQPSSSQLSREQLLRVEEAFSPHLEKSHSGGDVTVEVIDRSAGTALMGSLRIRRIEAHSLRYRFEGKGSTWTTYQGPFVIPPGRHSVHMEALYDGVCVVGVSRVFTVQ